MSVSVSFNSDSVSPPGETIKDILSSDDYFAIDYIMIIHEHVGFQR